MTIRFSPKKPHSKLIKFGTLDLETENRIYFKMGGIYDGSNYKEFWSLSSLVEYLQETDISIFYVHYLSFDAPIIMNYLLEHCIDFAPPTEVNGKVIELRVKSSNKKRKYVRLRDSFSLFPDSQANLVKSFGVETSKFEINDWSNVSDEDFVKRNYQDVKGLFEIMLKAQQYFFGLLGVDISRSSTISQLTKDSFQTKFLKQSLINPLLHGYGRNFFLDEQMNKDFRDSYAGGRTEVFDFDEHEEVKVFDVNSMYPACMLDDVPIERPVVKEDVSVEYFNHLRKKYYVIADVEITLKTDRIPLLWTRHEGKLLFTDFEESRGTFHSPEIDKAVELGAKILRVFRVYVFRQKAPIFKEYIEFLYALRLKAKKNKDKFQDYLCKLLMNSLYGKFAQNPERDKLIFLNDRQYLNDDYPPNTLVYADDTGFFYGRVKEFSPASFYFPHWSGCITARARVKLFEFLVESDCPVYCDTDSVMCHSLNSERVSKKLGDMKLEKTYYDFIAVQPKVYAHRDGWKAKGIPRQFGDEPFEVLFDGVVWDSVGSLRSSLNVVNNVESDNGLIKVIKRRRHINKSYSKSRVVNGKGVPFLLANNQLK